jgi:hypothetical protein
VSICGKRLINCPDMLWLDGLEKRQKLGDQPSRPAWHLKNNGLVFIVTADIEVLTFAFYSTSTLHNKLETLCYNVLCHNYVKQNSLLRHGLN